MKTHRAIILILFIVLASLLIALAILNLSPLQMVFELDPNNHRIAAIEERQQQIPAYLSLPAGFFTMYMINLLIAYLFPKRILNIEQSIPSSPSKITHRILLGLAAGVTIMAIIFSATISMFTFSYAILLTLGTMLASTLGSAAILFKLGRSLLRSAGWPHAAPQLHILAGLFVIYATISIPIVGWLALFLYSSLSLGLAVVTRFGSGRS